MGVMGPLRVDGERGGMIADGEGWGEVDHRALHTCNRAKIALEIAFACYMLRTGKGCHDSPALSAWTAVFFPRLDALF